MVKVRSEPIGEVSEPGTARRGGPPTIPMSKTFWIVTETLAASTTTSLTVKFPAVTYTCETVAPEAVEPSPKVHQKEYGSTPFEAEAVNDNVSPAVRLVGLQDIDPCNSCTAGTLTIIVAEWDRDPLVAVTLAE